MPTTKKFLPCFLLIHPVYRSASSPLSKPFLPWTFQDSESDPVYRKFQPGNQFQILLVVEFFVLVPTRIELMTSCPKVWGRFVILVCLAPLEVFARKSGCPYGGELPLRSLIAVRIDENLRHTMRGSSALVIGPFMMTRPEVSFTPPVALAK